MSAFYDLASLVLVPSGYKASKVYAQKPLTTDGQLTFGRASTATRVNASGLIESVASGVPRLDYQGSTCPKLQLEPQRTATMLNSENFAGWLGINNVTLGVNTTDTVSPDGTNNATKVTLGSSGPLRVFDFTQSAAGVGTISLFVKAGTSTNIELFTSSASLLVSFNLTTQEVTATTGTGTITSYGNGWYRITATATLGVSEVLQILFNGDPGQTIYIWGAMCEAGAYATSYVKTTSFAVTRLADACSKTGISSLIGQTEGTLFVEFFYNEQNNIPNGNDKSVCRIKTGAAYADEICILYFGDEGSSYGKTIQCQITTGNVSQATLTTPQTMVSGYYKVAVAYKANDFAMAVNGVIVATDNSGSVPACADLTLNESTRIQSNSSPKQLLLFKTRLTNAQLAELTAL